MCYELSLAPGSSQKYYPDEILEFHEEKRDPHCYVGKSLMDNQIKYIDPIHTQKIVSPLVINVNAGTIHRFEEFNQQLADYFAVKRYNEKYEVINIRLNRAYEVPHLQGFTPVRPSIFDLNR